MSAELHLQPNTELGVENTGATSLLKNQAWIHSAALDVPFILAPAFLVTVMVLVFQDWLTASSQVPLWFWVVMILCVDVAHVYATLFRTYLNPAEFNQQKALLIVIPLACWAVGAGLYSIDALWFWRALAYLAVFHFVRQQYGFMAIYSRSEPHAFAPFRWLDSAVIYLAMLYPLAYWHTHSRNFNWFVNHDFVQLQLPWLDTTALVLLALAGSAYLMKEIGLSLQNKTLNIPKNLIILGTAFSWIVGIVLLNGDMAFTATNVVSHGIPYMALVWIYGRRMANQKPEQALLSPILSRLNYRRMFSVAWVPVFILFLCVLGYIEEGIWDGFIWREHLSFFAMFRSLPNITSPDMLAWLVPLLALPQSTHYVLDGFIWRIREKVPASITWAKTLQSEGKAAS